jgi:hypothetical protein
VIEYRAYIVGHDGHLNGFEPLVCVEDTEAIDGPSALSADAMLSFGLAPACDHTQHKPE